MKTLATLVLAGLVTVVAGCGNEDDITGTTLTVQAAVPGVQSNRGVEGTSLRATTALDPITSLAGTTQQTQWYYFEEPTTRWWYIINTFGQIYMLDAVGSQYPGNIGWRPINTPSGTLSYGSYPSVGANFSSVSISSDGHSVIIGPATNTGLSQQAKAIQSSTQAVAWLYFLNGTTGGWYITEASSAASVYFLANADPSIAGGIGWMPIFNASYPGYPSAGQTFTSVSLGSNRRSTIFGASTTITAPPPPTVTVSVSSATVPMFGNVTVSWNSTNATSCTGSWSGTASIGLSGSVSKQPTSTTIYQVTCSGPGGSASDSKTVTVTAAVGSLAVTIAGLPSGANPNVSISGPSGYSKTLTGSATLTNLATGAYTITSQSVTVSGASYSPSPASASATVFENSTTSVTVTYASASLGAPSLSAPADVATGVSVTPTFTWSSVPGANRYWLTVAANAADLPTDVNAVSCSNCIISGNTDQLNYAAPNPFPFAYHTSALAAATKYYWKVQAYVANGAQGQYSGARSFTTGGSSGSSNSLDDYPFKTMSPTDSDPYGPAAGTGFFYRECTSFVAWRMNRDAGTPNAPYFFTNHMNGQHWSDATNWPDVAVALGFKKDHIPAVGAIAWFWLFDRELGTMVGHVAYVEHVNTNGSVDVSEYNRDVSHGFDYKPGVTDAVWFIHVIH